MDLITIEKCINLVLLLTILRMHSYLLVFFENLIIYNKKEYIKSNFQKFVYLIKVCSYIYKYNIIIIIKNRFKII
jgi:hypothetical protein